MSNDGLMSLPDVWRERLKKKTIYSFCIENGYFYVAANIEGSRFAAIALDKVYEDPIHEIIRIAEQTHRYSPYYYMGMVLFVPEVKSISITEKIKKAKEKLNNKDEENEEQK